MEIFLLIFIMAFIFGISWLVRLVSPANNKPADKSRKQSSYRSTDNEQAEDNQGAYNDYAEEEYYDEG